MANNFVVDIIVVISPHDPYNGNLRDQNIDKDTQASSRMWASQTYRCRGLNICLRLQFGKR